MPWMIRLGNIFLTSLVNLVMKETTCGSFWIVIGAHTRWQHITIKGISWHLGQNLETKFHGVARLIGHHFKGA